MKKKIFPLAFIVFTLLFTSCKEKAMNLIFTWDGNFTHEFLVAIIETPPENFQPDSAMPGNTTVDEFNFFGVGMDKMRELLLQFGDCDLHFQVDITVELNGFKIEKIYIPKGAKLFFGFNSENPLPELIHITSDTVMKAYPDHRLNFSSDNKSFDFYCSYPMPYVIYERPADADKSSGANNDDMDLSKMKASDFKQDGVKVKLKGNKVVMSYKDKKTPTTMTLVLEKAKGK